MWKPPPFVMKTVSRELNVWLYDHDVHLPNNTKNKHWNNTQNNNNNNNKVVHWDSNRLFSEKHFGAIHENSDLVFICVVNC